MRKILAALLAVLMLSSVLAIAAGAETVTFDKSTSDKTPDLVITEVLTDSVTGEDGYNDLDAYEYIEIYNRGSSAVDLSQYCLLMCDNNGNNSSSDTWLSTHKFTGKINLKAGDVYNDSALASAIQSNHSDAWAVQNPTNLTLDAGKFAIIWIWNNDSNTLSEHYNESLAASDSTRPSVTFPKFRDFYASESGGGATIPEDTLILVAMGATTIAGNTSANPNGFNLANNGHRVYALAKNTYDLTAHSALTSAGTLNSDIVCLFRWGYRKKSGIPSVTYPQTSTIYVPSSAEPYLANKGAEINAEEGTTPATYTDYAERDAARGFDVSYNEVSILTYWEAPTPGTMMPYQWIYVDEARIPDSAKKYTYNGNADGELAESTAVNENWKADSLAALVAAKVTSGEDVAGTETDRGEVNYKDRSELGNQGNNKKKTDTKKGLPTWALILIIVGGVLVAGAAAFVVIIVIKKKNKPVAADDVAAEGEVAIIDESAESEAPASGDEAPASGEEPTEAPSEEEKPE